ncbi:rhomboid family intramembrane serine protease [Mucilaginibacter koreensis]
MSTLWQEIRTKMLHSGSKLGLLIGINVAVYVIIAVAGVFEFLTLGRNSQQVASFASDYLALTSYLPKLLTRFWTPVTYMFMHAGFFHILFNMLWLYWMGQIFEEYLGTKRTVGLYLMGGLAGALLFLAAYNLIPAFADVRDTALIVGASASVMAIVIATATLLPDYTIYLMFLGPVKLKWLAIAYVIIDFIGIAGANAGGEIAHLGGALLGFIYIKQLQRGNDWNKPVSKIFTPPAKVKVVYRSNSGYTTRTAAPAYPDQDEIDRILDKISHTGYKSLSKQERDTLQRASNNE